MESNAYFIVFIELAPLKLISVFVTILLYNFCNLQNSTIKYVGKYKINGMLLNSSRLSFNSVDMSIVVNEGGYGFECVESYYLLIYE